MTVKILKDFNDIKATSPPQKNFTSCDAETPQKVKSDAIAEQLRYIKVLNVPNDFKDFKDLKPATTMWRLRIINNSSRRSRLCDLRKHSLSHCA